jgi:hypothetical protein
MCQDCNDCLLLRLLLVQAATAAASKALLMLVASVYVYLDADQYLAACCCVHTSQGVDTTSTTVISTVKGEWLQYTRTFAAGGPYDIYLTGAYRARGTKNGAYASVGLQFFKPYTNTPLPGASGTLLLLPLMMLLLLFR